MVAPDDLRIRAQPLGHPDRHGRPHSKFPRFIRAGSYHAPVPAPNDQGNSIKLRIQQPFTRYKKRIQIHMYNRSFHDSKVGTLYTKIIIFVGINYTNVNFIR